jgi:hypothetical protein
MKYLWTALVAPLTFAIVTIPGTHTTRAQQATSGTASSVSSSISPAASNATRVQNTDLYGTTSATSGRDLDPLQKSDRDHADSTRTLLAQYQRSTDQDERKKLSDELEKVVTEHFEIRQKIRAQELEELNAQIRRLQELHDRREQDKSQIINDRLRQLLRDAEGLGWGPNDLKGADDLQPFGETVRPPMRSVSPVNRPR